MQKGRWALPLLSSLMIASMILAACGGAAAPAPAAPAEEAAPTEEAVAEEAATEEAAAEEAATEEAAVELEEPPQAVRTLAAPTTAEALIKSRREIIFIVLFSFIRISQHCRFFA